LSWDRVEGGHFLPWRCRDSTPRKIVQIVVKGLHFGALFVIKCARLDRNAKAVHSDFSLLLSRTTRSTKPLSWVIDGVRDIAFTQPPPLTLGVQLTPDPTAPLPLDSVLPTPLSYKCR